MPLSDKYPHWVGLIYVFNLIVGTGALTLPAAFASAGWLFSTFMLMLLCFVSFINVTFVIESMACANATIEWRRIQSHKIDESEVSHSTDSERETTSTEETAILSTQRTKRYYSLNRKVELGEMAALYLSKTGHVFFFVSLCVYLFGDLTIYAAASGKTLVNLSCRSSNNSENFTEYCWDDTGVTKMDIYRMYVTVFGLLIGPFTYFNVQKTKYLQMFTVSVRWIAFTIMLTLACVRLLKYGQQGHPGLINLVEVPALAGSSVYSFMCHHSLPGLIAPFSSKNRIMLKISYDFFLICAFYLLLSLTGSFAFESLDVLYSLNFIQTGDSGTVMKIVGFFLAAFPLFPMSTSFPIIAITLQANLTHLFVNCIERRGFFVRRLLFPTLAVFPPIILALSTHNLKTLIEVTGSYAGVIVQYIVPAVLVINARKRCLRDFGSISHRYTSPFKHYAWFCFVILWALLCIIFVTVDFIINH
ncbi:transmembrane protein 104 homolog [Cylas formicarius]|uniref:transmembrane protein 104 homolog n=1 Tax=Cylas formicarius TaxID=197179 RepID=UPI0029587D7B|nr:transmembrane protein 104 homolog [Cylas formicarius]